MKKRLVLFIIVVVSLLWVVPWANPTKAGEGPGLVNLAEPFPYNVVILEGCRYITYRASPTQRGLTHAGSCKNPVHSIYGRIADGKSNKDVGVPVKDV